MSERHELLVLLANNDPRIKDRVLTEADLSDPVTLDQIEALYGEQASAVMVWHDMALGRSWRAGLTTSSPRRDTPVAYARFGPGAQQVLRTLIEGAEQSTE